MSDVSGNDMTVIKTLGKPSYQLAIEDIASGIADHKRWRRFSFFYIKRAYWRTSLGIGWPVLSFTLFVLMLSLLWGSLFGRDLRIYLPHFGYGFTCWIFLNAIIAGGDQVFNAHSGIIREFPLPLSFYAFAKMAKEMVLFVISLGCMIIIDIVYIHALGPIALLAVPAVLLYIVDAVLVAMIVGMLTTRFRDVSQVVPNLMRAFFFFTPVLWSVEDRGKLWPIIVANPMYHAIEIVRAPMSGRLPTLLNWTVMLGITIILLFIVLSFFKIGTRQLRVWL